MTIVEDRAYFDEIRSLLLASTLTTATYRPIPAVTYKDHAAVLVGVTPVVLCGAADDPASWRQAWALVRSSRFAAGVREAGYAGDIFARTVSGMLTTAVWADTMTAIVGKESGSADNGIGPLIAIVLNDPNKTLATYLCVTTETARALDPKAPALDDGFFCELARGRLPTRRH